MIGNNFYSWAISDSGQIRHGKIWDDYTVELKRGDLITCVINRTKGQLTFEINGVEGGVAYSDLKLKNLELYPAVSLMRDAKVSFVKV